METVVGVAIGVAAVVFLFTAIGVAFLIKKKCKKKPGLSSDGKLGNKRANYQSTQSDVCFSEEFGAPDLEAPQNSIDDDDIWVDDASEITTHCISILKGCHDLISRLVPIALKEYKMEEDENQKIEEMARKVMPFIDDIVELIESPLNLHLCESRCSALFDAVSNMVRMVKNQCVSNESLLWVDLALGDVEQRLNALREDIQKLNEQSTKHTQVQSPSSTMSHAEHSLGRNSNTKSDSTESGIDVHALSDQNSSDSDVTTSSVKATNLSEEVNDKMTAKHLNICHVNAEVHSESDKGIELKDTGYTNHAHFVDEITV